MPRRLLAKLKQFIEGDPAVRMVADDPALVAELLLLFRMVLADGKVQERELGVLKRICAQSFGIEGDSFTAVVEYLHSFGYEINTGQAIGAFRELGLERRRLLARHLATIAKADEELSAREVRLLARVIELLDLEPEDAIERGDAG